MRRVLLLIALASCKEGLGDRCLVDSDCSSGLICNHAKNTCEAANAAGGIDATVPDGPPIDAMPDAPDAAGVAP